MQPLSVSIKIAAAYFFIAIFTSAHVFAQNSGQAKQKTLKPTALSADFDITGTLSNPAWNQATVHLIEYEIRPKPNATAARK